MHEQPGVLVKRGNEPDGGMSFLDGSERSVVELPGEVSIGRGTYLPGWRWSQHARPLSGQDSQHHVGFIVSGRMCVQGNDGRKVEVGPGDAFVAEAGHDAWVLGEEPCVALDLRTSTKH